MESLTIMELVRLASSKDLSLEIMMIDGGLHIQLNDNIGSIYSTYSTNSILEVFYNIERFITNYQTNNSYIDNLIEQISVQIVE